VRNILAPCNCRVILRPMETHVTGIVPSRIVSSQVHPRRSSVVAMLSLRFLGEASNAAVEPISGDDPATGGVHRDAR
jgi:hypothetical protein